MCFTDVSAEVSVGCFLIAECLRVFLYILDNGLLSDVPFANVFPQPVAFLLIHLTLLFKEQFVF